MGVGAFLEGQTVFAVFAKNDSVFTRIWKDIHVAIVTELAGGDEENAASVGLEEEGRSQGGHRRPGVLLQGVQGAEIGHWGPLIS